MRRQLHAHGGKTSKLFLSLDGMPVLAHTLLAYQRSPLITEIIIAAKESDVDAVVALCNDYRITKLSAVVIGGANRQESALRAFSVIGPEIHYVGNCGRRALSGHADRN